MRKLASHFKRVSDFPLEHIATFRFVPGVGWSDHRSFWRHGYRALMITDTAPFRYPHYHTPDDTVDKIDFDRLSRVVVNLDEVVRKLANE